MSSDLAKKLVWMFGSPRTGSTWLMQLLADAPEVGQIDEPYIPLHLVPMDHTVPEGEYYEHGVRANDPNYFFARRYLPEFKPQLRELILTGFRRQLTELGQDPETLRWLVIKEPNGSHAADSVMSLFPESRLIFLLRDGRDVIDSLMDAMMGADSWWQKHQSSDKPQIAADRMGFVHHNTRLWLNRTLSTQRAFQIAGEEQRFLVRYEELLDETQPLLEAMLRWLRLDSSAEQVREVVERRSFAAIPEDQKGPGKRARSANPGQWRERLLPAEIEVIEREMGDKLRELGYPAIEDVQPTGG
ncbi:MAG TPA: sulfotransferase [Solirubrobacterales bacterium]|nr:sulfotransferase [Solirubrobacterales bacterium]